MALVIAALVVIRVARSSWAPESINKSLESAGCISGSHLLWVGHRGEGSGWTYRVLFETCSFRSYQAHGHANVLAGLCTRLGIALLPEFTAGRRYISPLGLSSHSGAECS
jgi:hypothetical protein